MEETSRRSLEPHEREVLIAHLRSARGIGWGLLAALLLGIVVLAFEPVLVARLAERSGLAAKALALGVAVALGAWVVFRGTRHDWRRELARLALQDLEGGEAEITRYLAKAAVRVEEMLDEGTSYYLELRDGRTLFLSGDYLYESEHAGTFPCREFEIARAPHSRILLGFRCLGELITPCESVPPFAVDELEGNLIPDDGALVPQTLEEVREARLARTGR